MGNAHPARRDLGGIEFMAKIFLLCIFAVRKRRCVCGGFGVCVWDWLGCS